MLRIHLTGEDLARVRVAERPDPLWETVLSCHRFRDRRGRHAYGAWREGVRRRIGAPPPTLRALIPLTGYFPDFLNPPESQESWESAIEALRGTPRRRLAADIALLETGQPVPGWVRSLADGDRSAVVRLVTDLERYYRAALLGDAVWTRVQAGVAADRAVRLRHLLAGGTEGLLTGLRPVLRWNPPVLEADYPVARELRPGGRGLLLVPSYFCGRLPVTYADDTLTPVLVYPIEHAPPPPPNPTALAKLLGGTRARVLRAIEHGTTTGELAHRAGVSPASASQHARVLRDAGLVRSVRHGSEVVHTLTPLGTELLA
ncbi:ArsR/SmtB family transcription factor [Streptomyces litchfieldiae]|uniref:Winged helix-turn-helix domain-containing protein n=1 Tax=Streptomyces litchfieldiae TaxID=3075543 RepID=A0ABU2MUC7_9ACTN|nr:winged helix-turn-helix domain-containing protein [Streptomyces sp. DSM 44938]MDT0345246.1 winged helix-turn-helix domain-containing protein [Streptomyces sp. DSM 44938]